MCRKLALRDLRVLNGWLKLGDQETLTVVFHYKDQFLHKQLVKPFICNQEVIF